MKQHIALAISRLAHPLLLISLFIIYSTYTIQDPRTAAWTSFAILGIAVIPLIGWNIWKTHKGEYSNFDVSIREQRFSMFGIIFSLSLILIGFLYFSGQPSVLIIGCLLLIEAMLLIFILNFWIKASLHMTISTFICCGLLPLNATLAAILGIIVPFIGWARITQKRHSWEEVLAGMATGLFTGIQLLFWTGYFD
ncbi:hypothetical protein [Lunatibacter salilacus]|uniref:hypothetical protein n=1 Tax=Lunatibacter salilacus TaxID=2483804 RepID=UPI00131B6F94|nr:hypothetical protein [Lunatibacter salilacus]